jgi:hypothetical protein
MGKMVPSQARTIEDHYFLVQFSDNLQIFEHCKN